MLEWSDRADKDNTCAVSEVVSNENSIRGCKQPPVVEEHQLQVQSTSSDLPQSVQVQDRSTQPAIFVLILTREKKKTAKNNILESSHHGNL